MKEDPSALQLVHMLAEKEGVVEAPTDIAISETKAVQLPPLTWKNYGNPPAKFVITNTGHTVNLGGKWESSRSYLRDGPFKGQYVFAQMHFHWGPNDETGSEHSVDGVKMPMELHVVHINRVYRTQELALKENDGVAILNYLFQLQEEDNSDLTPIVEALPMVTLPQTSTTIEPMAIEKIIVPFQKDYFMYWGSVSSAICKHRILWMTSRTPLGISSAQLAQFRQIRDVSGQYMVRNFRETHPRTSYTLFHVNPSSKLESTLLAPFPGHALAEAKLPFDVQAEQDAGKAAGESPEGSRRSSGSQRTADSAKRPSKAEAEGQRLSGEGSPDDKKPSISGSTPAEDDGGGGTRGEGADEYRGDDGYRSLEGTVLQESSHPDVLSLGHVESGLLEEGLLQEGQDAGGGLLEQTLSGGRVSPTSRVPGGVDSTGAAVEADGAVLGPDGRTPSAGEMPLGDGSPGTLTAGGRPEGELGVEDDLGGGAAAGASVDGGGLPDGGKASAPDGEEGVDAVLPGMSLECKASHAESICLEDKEERERQQLSSEVGLGRLSESQNEGSTDGQTKGVAEGQAAGLAEGQTAGLAEGQTAELAKGQTAGLAEGQTAGLADDQTKSVTEDQTAGLAEGQTAGLADGQTKSVTEGQTAGLADDQTKSVTEDQTAGLAEGQTAGLADGQTKSVPEGQTAGLAEGQTAGLADGQAAGLADGQAAGLAEGQSSGLAEGPGEGLGEGLTHSFTEGPAKELEDGFAEGHAASQEFVDATDDENAVFDGEEGQNGEGHGGGGPGREPDGDGSQGGEGGGSGGGYGGEGGEDGGGYGGEGSEGSEGGGGGGQEGGNGGGGQDGGDDGEEGGDKGWSDAAGEPGEADEEQKDEDGLEGEHGPGSLPGTGGKPVDSAGQTPRPSGSLQAGAPAGADGEDRLSPRGSKTSRTGSLAGDTWADAEGGPVVGEGVEGHGQDLAVGAASSGKVGTAMDQTSAGSGAGSRVGSGVGSGGVTAETPGGGPGVAGGVGPDGQPGGAGQTTEGAGGGEAGVEGGEGGQGSPDGEPAHVEYDFPGYDLPPPPLDSSQFKYFKPDLEEKRKAPPPVFINSLAVSPAILHSRESLAEFKPAPPCHGKASKFYEEEKKIWTEQSALRQAAEEEALMFATLADEERELMVLDAARRKHELRQSPDKEITGVGWPFDPLQVDQMQSALLSPIDLSLSGLPDVKLQPLVFDGHFSPDAMTRIANTGETLEVRVLNPEMTPILYGGPLHDDYIFDSMHFHWSNGSSPESLGSAHKIGGQRFCMEVHLLHYAMQYGSKAEALKHQAGLCAVAFMLHLTGIENAHFARLVRELSKVEAPMSCAPLEHNAMLSLAEVAHPYGYITYPGTLIGREDNLNVVWIVYPKPVGICCQHTAEFQKLHAAAEFMSSSLLKTHDVADRPVLKAVPP